MNSKDKGNIGEAIVLAEFTKRQIQVAIPFGDNARYDLIAEFNGKLNKIQVKYCGQITENNSFICPCASSTNHTTNKHLSTYDNDVDFFATMHEGECYLIPYHLCGKRTQRIRFVPTKSGQTKGILFAKDFHLEDIIKTL